MNELLAFNRVLAGKVKVEDTILEVNVIFVGTSQVKADSEAGSLAQQFRPHDYTFDGAGASLSSAGTTTLIAAIEYKAGMEAMILFTRASGEAPLFSFVIIIFNLNNNIFQRPYRDCRYGRFSGGGSGTEEGRSGTGINSFHGGL